MGNLRKLWPHKLPFKVLGPLGVQYLGPRTRQHLSRRSCPVISGQSTYTYTLWLQPSYFHYWLIIQKNNPNKYNHSVSKMSEKSEKCLSQLPRVRCHFLKLIFCPTIWWKPKNIQNYNHRKQIKAASPYIWEAGTRIFFVFVFFFAKSIIIHNHLKMFQNLCIFSGENELQQMEYFYPQYMTENFFNS